MDQKYIVVDPCQLSAPYNYCLLDGLAKRGADVTYAIGEYAHEGGRPYPNGIKTLTCFFFLAAIVNRFNRSQKIRRVLRMVEYPFNVLFLVGYILAKRIRIVHFMWSLTPTADQLLYRLLQLLGRRVVYTAHNPFPHERKPSDARKFAKLYRTVDHIIVLTKNTANEIREVCDIPEARVSVIPHGDFDPLFAHYPRNEQLVEDIRTKANGRKIVAFLGLIRPYKGLDYFINSFPLIKKRVPDVFFLVAGAVGIGNQELIQADIAANCEPNEAWIDLRFLPTSDLTACVAAMDVLVMPYINASQSGNTVMAYSAGVPVIATDVGGLAEMTTNDVTGYVIPPRDSDAIADAVAKCFEPGKYEQLSVQVRHAAANEYSWSSIAAQTIVAYNG